MTRKQLIDAIAAQVAKAAIATRGQPAVKVTTTWGSKNAEDLFKIATRLAGFDAKKLMLEIHRRQRDKSRTVNETTVERAMQALSERFDATGQQ